MEKLKHTKRISAFCPKALNIYKRLSFGILLGLMSFVMIPKKESVIASLSGEVQFLKSTVVKLEQKIFRQDLIIQRKDKELARQKIKIESVKVLPKKAVKYEPEVIRTERKLTRYDSVSIASVMIDSMEIYYQVQERILRKAKGGVKQYHGEGNGN
jgi:hypothetical protein